MQSERLIRLARAQFRRRWWLQVPCFGLIWAGSDLAVRQWQLPIPSGVLGLAMLLLMLEAGIFSVGWFRRGAARLLAHLVLFFVPAMLAVVNHGELMSATGLKLLAAVLIGTPLVMLGTALVVEAGFRLARGHER